MNISSAVVQWSKSRTPVLEKASSNLAWSFIFFTVKYFLCTDTTENSLKRENAYFCVIVHMYT